jgi:hypothetical protein
MGEGGGERQHTRAGAHVGEGPAPCRCSLTVLAGAGALIQELHGPLPLLRAEAGVAGLDLDLERLPRRLHAVLVRGRRRDFGRGQGARLLTVVPAGRGRTQTQGAVKGGTRSWWCAGACAALVQYVKVLRGLTRSWWCAGACAARAVCMQRCPEGHWAWGIKIRGRTGTWSCRSLTGGASRSVAVREHVRGIISIIKVELVVEGNSRRAPSLCSPLRSC